MRNINTLEIPQECLSDPVVPPEYQQVYDSMTQFLTSPIFNPPVTYIPMQFGLHIITASAGIEFWDVAGSNEMYSDAPAHYDLATHKLMIDMAKEIGIDYIQIRTRYPDNNYVPGAEEALHGAIQYAKSKGIDIYLMFIPEGLEHLHIPYGDSAAFMQKFYDFAAEYITAYKPQYYQLYGQAQIKRSIGVNTDDLLPEMYAAIKSASPSTLYVEAEGANLASQVTRFKALCNIPYNDVMGIPLHDLYSTTYLQNLQDMIQYARSKNRVLICPDAWLTDAHLDKPWELMFNPGWREPLDRDYMGKVVNFAQSAGLSAISSFYGNHFVSYNPGFFYPVTHMDSSVWVSCLKNGSRTTLPQAYKSVIDKVRSSAVSESYALYAVIGILGTLGAAAILYKILRR